MSSAGAQCNHLNHVSTQLPYAMVAALISFVCYIIAGFTKSAVITLPIGILILFLFVSIVKKKNGAIDSE